MKKWFYHLPVKVLCILLCVLSLFCTAVSAFGLVNLLYQNGYRLSYEEMCESAMEDRYSWLGDMIVDRYHNYAMRDPMLEQYLEDLRGEVDFYCTLSSSKSGIVYSDYSDQEYFAHISERYYYSTEDGSLDTVYDVSVYLRSPTPGSNLETELALLKFFWVMRYALIAIFGICALLSILLCVFLCCAAGRRGEELPKSGFFDRVLWEIYLLGGFFALILEMEFFDIAPAQLWFGLFAMGIFFLVDVCLLILLMMTSAVRIKTGTFLSTSLLGKIWQLLCRSRTLLARLWEDISLVPKVAVALGTLALFDLILATMLDFTEYLAALLIEGLVLMGVLIWYAAAVQRLQKDLDQIADGKLDHRCDLSRLPPGLRSFGEEMNRSAEGMEKAVEEKLKSERFKTELITNVSHDIKTPLTSIVNYVDLMKKEETDNERMKEYLEVLDRQSSRLKKLTEDLVESSKAASGVLSVELAQCDVGVLLEQAMGEYQVVLEERGLVPCLALPENPVYILADGKRLWRVLDNLFNNIQKYALSGTRVYVSLEERGDQVDIIFRNISAEPIRVSGDHLSERFVRGDLSRNTEGSGLGLAIARSLAELQKGSLAITVDGDLFKAVVTFDRYQ